ncbi:prolyl endopeptidase-like isoform X2 [Latimeria chalumnae]|uniref:prolyl endopeptidase-like isoform X2 n=1 Tax=Latimeria chalumnae TaxID=7897 RepID=UPI0003C10CA9|nr:PREDICTED: prolyl endopeptidase-like isoform X2 [Latimeria chalumnae]|eukprot:XP_005999618.1 PREDICTED: prolyl endopeptidase-like isoform X2 [Latimeria chalumnae]
MSLLCFKPLFHTVRMKSHCITRYISKALVSTYGKRDTCHKKAFLCTVTRLENYKESVCPNNFVARRHVNKGLIRLEIEYFNSVVQKYDALTAVFKKEIETKYGKYAFSTCSPLIHLGEYVYFEEKGYIYRCKIDNGNEIPEVLVSVKHLDVHDASVQRIRLSPNQKYLAATVKSSLCEESLCVVVKLGNVPEVASILPNVFSFEWATDDTLFYTTLENLQCHQVFHAVFKAERHYTELVYTEKDPRFFVEVACTKDHRFITINSNSKSTSEVWMIDCRHPLDSPFLVQERIPGLVYHIEHRNNELYLLTNYEKGAEYKLMKTPVDAFGMENWQLVYSVKEKCKLIDMDMFKDHCVMLLKHWGTLHLDVISLNNTSTVTSVKLPSWACTFETKPNHVYSATGFSFGLASPIQPTVNFLYSLDENKLYIRKEETTPVILKDYHSERLKVKSKDGTLVPVTVFHKTPLGKLNSKPLLVHVYGAYGMDLDMSFKPEMLQLLEDGWILAYCHVRGGGELGLKWHEEGKLDKKSNGLDDLKACILQLHNLGYSQPRSTALIASSAGGVLVGALCNSNAELFRATVLRSPFLDILSTMMDLSLPLTIEEHEEWGNPHSDDAKYIKIYCPYRNIKPQRYPSILITAYENDQRVPLLGLLKYTAKLRNAVTSYASVNSNQENDYLPNIILDIQPGGDHFGPTNFEDSISETRS